MTDDLAMKCAVCDGLLSNAKSGGRPNLIGVCTRTSACKRERYRRTELKRKASNLPRRQMAGAPRYLTNPRSCEVCGGALYGKNATGICNRNPVCVKLGQKKRRQLRKVPCACGAMMTPGSPRCDTCRRLRNQLRPDQARRYLDQAGYITFNAGGRPIKEHRWLMEQHLGRKLLPHENVHHINGDRADNRLENLELWSTSQPSGQRIRDKVAWAVELLTLYAPELLAADEPRMSLQAA